MPPRDYSSGRVIRQRAVFRLLVGSAILVTAGIAVVTGSRGAVGQFPGFGGGAFPEGGFIARFGLVQSPPPLRADPAIDPSGLRAEAKYFRLNSLKTVTVPIPSDIGLYIKDQRAAIALGKAFFWEQQVGSDGMACASCHFHAGADRRTKHQISPGILGGNGKFDPLPSGTASGGVNYQLKREDFPLHQKLDATKHYLSANVKADSDDVVSSAGVLDAMLTKLGPQVVPRPKRRSPTMDVTTIREMVARGEVPSSDALERIVPNPTTPKRVTVPEVLDAATPDTLGFRATVRGKSLNVRRSQPRNTPTTINAVFNHRNFWDGRANFIFNGVTPFGNRDPDARVMKFAGGKLAEVRVAIDNASLASQAVGPALSIGEMSAQSRDFRTLGRKLLGSTPLVLQDVSASDSVLGAHALSTPAALKKGLKVKYQDLIQQAFTPEWWAAPGSPVLVNGVAYTQTEANFSLFFGLAVMMYERTLVSDQTPFDRFMEGDDTALDARQRLGLSLFIHEGQCINCHSGPEFTGASIRYLEELASLSDVSKYELIERMWMRDGEAIYDAGFYNINVRPASEDVGVGGTDPFGQPLSFSAQATGVSPDVDQVGPTFDSRGFVITPGTDPKPGERLSVKGSFKVPSLRNIDLTGPYFHNGGQLTLEQVVQFYARGSDFADWNRAHGFEGDPDIEVISELNGDRERIQAVAAFLRSLTDPRVAYERAPFDHPGLKIPNGHKGIGTALSADTLLPGTAVSDFVTLPAVGATGNSAPIQPVLGGSLVDANGQATADGLPWKGRFAPGAKLMPLFPAIHTNGL
ncbi:MAG: cytochrome C peroxidase [Planctomycetota bacterium]|nr:cytochrome C peroxidase [Planctomycetota bacterium]